MIYLLDACVFLTAKNLYYQMGRVPEFWEWLTFWGEKGNVKVPSEIMDEITCQDDQLGKWMREKKDIFLIDEPIPHVNKIFSVGYDIDPTNIDEARIGRVGQDPFLIAYGLNDIANRIVITEEAPSPKRQEYNKKIPDVCLRLHVDCQNVYYLIDKLDFRTNWNRNLGNNSIIRDD